MMVPALTLHLLGDVQISRGGQPLQFRAQTEAALLIYLAHSGQVQSRESVADLLWEARSTRQSLSNLRTALARLRKRAGDVLLISRKTLAYEPAGRQQVDSVRLVEQLDALDVIKSDVEAARLRETLQLYEGDFLAEFHLPAASRFNDWVAVTQEQIRQKLFAGCRRLLDYALVLGDHDLAIETVTRWLQWEPLDEWAQQQLIRTLAQIGQTAAALAQYERFSAKLAEELAVAPQKATTALIEQIREGNFEKNVESISEPAPHNLPRELTPFFGRTAEINEVTRYVLDPAYPLITLTGEGGIGKTRLSLAVARHILQVKHSLPDGLWFISLAEVRFSSEDTIPDRVREAVSTAIGNAIGMPFHGRRLPSEQLFAFLKEKRCLLILDNLEPLLDSDAIDLLLDLLQEAPNSQLLVTSRAALDLNSEWVVRLEGLPTPVDSTNPTGLLQPDAEEYDSVRLFAERAARTSKEFRLADELSDVAVICHLVEGLPLAIELAASASRQLTCREILSALQAGIDTLATSRRDVPIRQRSMRAVFEYSWKLLAEAEQRVLAQLSVFRGSFTGSAASAVILAHETRLNGLQRHSLLRKNVDGRYQMHPLLCEYAAEKLLQLDSSKIVVSVGAVERHSAYYLAAVGKLAAVGRQSPHHFAEIQPDLDNIRLAWHNATLQLNITALTTGWRGLSTFYFRRSLFQEGEETFRRSADRLHTSNSSQNDAMLLLAKLKIAQAMFLNVLNHYDQAIELAREILDSLHELLGITAHELDMLQAKGEIVWGTALYRMGQFEASLAHLSVALSAAQRSHLINDEITANRRIGTSLLEMGQFAGALASFEAALIRSREIDDRMSEGSILTELGWLAQRENRLDEALDYAQRAYDTHLAINNRHGAGMALINMANVHEYLGDFSEAIACRQQVLRFLRDIDDRYHRTLVYHGQGLLLSRIGDYKGAKEYYERTLAIDRDLKDAAGQAWTANNLGLLYNHLGDFEQALQIHKTSLQSGRSLGSRPIEALALLRLGQDLFGLGRFAEAEGAYQDALELLTELGQMVWSIEARSGLARAQIELNWPDRALSNVEEVLAFMADNLLTSAREPLLVYWNCYVVLRSTLDPRAPEVLKSGHARLRQQAARIKDIRQRNSYINNIKINRAIVKEMLAFQ